MNLRCVHDVAHTTRQYRQRRGVQRGEVPWRWWDPMRLQRPVHARHPPKTPPPRARAGPSRPPRTGPSPAHPVRRHRGKRRRKRPPVRPDRTSTPRVSSVFACKTQFGTSPPRPAPPPLSPAEHHIGPRGRHNPSGYTGRGSDPAEPAGTHQCGAGRASAANSLSFPRTVTGSGIDAKRCHGGWPRGGDSRLRGGWAPRPPEREPRQW